MTFTSKQLNAETDRLFEKLQYTSWSRSDCELLAPMTLEIAALKKEKNAIILAHSYQTPDIMYGVADHVGDSYGLSKIAAQSDADTIVFCSVYFMGETAKILNPQKRVLVPAVAGCSLADGITAADVRELKKQYPGRPVVTYVNTSADVKAESDICCTSANALAVIESFPDDEIIFIPDVLMGKNLQKKTKKKLILWDATCVVHEKFDEQSVAAIREEHPKAKILAHYECTPGVVDVVDMVGSTNDMMTYVRESDAEQFMLITECGITDRVKTEFIDKNIVGTCSLCPFMKKIMMKDILTALKTPTEEQIVSIPDDVIKRAKGTLDRMLEIT